MDMDTKFPLPLAFDRVMEGTAVAAQNSPLFRIPTEILTLIVSSLVTNKEDLASLALVNSDCRQLARSCQFRTVKLDASPRSESILAILQREAVERRQNHGHTRSLSLSACIRCVAVDHAGYWEEIHALRPRKPGRSFEDTSDDAYDDDEDKVQQWRASVGEITHRLNEIYRPNVLFVISSLVHLESLDMSQADWSQSLLNNLAACTIKHLSLRDVQMTDVVPTMEDSVVFPLETLDIRFCWDFEFSYGYSGPRLNASNSWNTILRLSSASLKILTLSHHAVVGDKEAKEDAVTFSLQFPQLRQLDLTWESHFDQSALRSLILTSPHLSTLAINYGHQATRELLDLEGQIQSLETLVLHHSEDIPDDSPLDFLTKNPQLKAFAFHYSGTSTLLERTLSFLAAFSQLVKLSMTWNGVHIPDSSLNALTCLSSLEVLHLSSGFQVGWRHDWPICHDTIISRLKPLRRLRQVAFTRDVYSYTREGRLFQYASYLQLRYDAWDLHHQCMLAQALAYAKAFPKLEFIYVGKISFKVTRVKNSIELEATDDNEFSWMRSMFGINSTYARFCEV
ncbi:MAG: hypothetical protein Q9217_006816 [Psora testacea]